eukprot:767718-Amphidinium_carterae.1
MKQASGPCRVIKEALPVVIRGTSTLLQQSVICRRIVVFGPIAASCACITSTHLAFVMVLPVHAFCGLKSLCSALGPNILAVEVIPFATYLN